MKTIISKSPERTLSAGEALGSSLRRGDFVALTGELGSGKTIFTKGIAKGLGVRGHRYVNSPTFVILKEYAGRIPLYHFDVYRIDSECGLDTVGYKEYFYGKGVTVVEWADRIKSLLPAERVEVSIFHSGEGSRRIRIKKQAPKRKA